MRRRVGGSSAHAAGRQLLDLRGAGSDDGTTGRTSFEPPSKRGGGRHPALERDAEPAARRRRRRSWRPGSGAAGAGSRTTGTSIGEPTSAAEAQRRAAGARTGRPRAAPPSTKRDDGDRAVLGEQERERLAAGQARASGDARPPGCGRGRRGRARRRPRGPRRRRSRAPATRISARTASSPASARSSSARLRLAGHGRPTARLRGRRASRSAWRGRRRRAEQGVQSGRCRASGGAWPRNASRAMTTKARSTGTPGNASATSATRYGEVVALRCSS